MKARVGHFEIPAAEPRRAARFFRDAFGWTAEEVDWPGPTYFKLRAPAAPAEAGLQGGLLAAAGAGFDRPLPVIHLAEGTIEECLARIVAAGGHVEEPPREVGDLGRFARFRDPEGHSWGLWTSSE